MRKRLPVVCTCWISALLVTTLAGCTAPHIVRTSTIPPASVQDAGVSPSLTPTPIPSATPFPTHTGVPIRSSTPVTLPGMSESHFTLTGSERPLLLAHYMPWYQAPPTSPDWGWHWTMNHFKPKQNADGSWNGFASHYQPLTGLYDSSDEEVLEYQAQLMKLSGIDGVIVDWYGMEDWNDYGLLNNATGKLFAAIKKAGLKFVICYEDQTIRHMINGGHLKTADAAAHGKKVMDYLQNTWFADDAYLKVDGRPILFIFGPQYFKDGSTWTGLFARLPKAPLFVTLNKPVPPEAEAAFPWPPMWAAVNGVLDHKTLLGYLDDFYARADDWDYVVGGAFPGFNDIYKEAWMSAGYGSLDALDGETFHFTLQIALNHSPDAIQLITWNDYGEGTNIEPAVEYEYRYLEMVQEARRATDPQFDYTSDDLRLPLQVYQMQVQAQKDQNTAALAVLRKAAAALTDGNVEETRKILTTLK